MKGLAYLAALLLALLAATAMRWAVQHFTDAPRPPRVLDDPRLTFQPAAHLARAAVRAYRALPPHERSALRQAIAHSTTYLDPWSATTAADAGLVCLGESHNEDMRRFVAGELLPRLTPEVLMLETGTRALTDLLDRHREGLAVDLLGAPLTPILEAVGRQPRPASLVAIDEPPAQRRGRAGGNGSSAREHALVASVRRHWRPGARHVVLFGALHCRDLPGWLYWRLAREDPEISGHGMLGVVLLARHQQPGSEMLFYVLEEIGFHGDVLVIPDVSRFPRQVQEWLPPAAQALAGYGSAILFDPGRPATGRLGATVE